MPVNPRTLIGWSMLVVLLASIAWGTLSTSLPPADLTLVNGTEVKSVDPAIVNGSPEGRIVNAIFEGLTRWDPKTLEPISGLAKSWEISADQLTYTFHMREEARWSDGLPITAQDFLYSMRRFLGPRTVAEYAYQAWYIKNAHNYSLGSSGIESGDKVEIELNLPVDAINTLRGELLHGILVSKEKIEGTDDLEFVVEIDGNEQRFRATDDQRAESSPTPTGARWCRQVLLDFREVGVKVVDPLTLQMTLESPTPFFLNLTGFYPLYPVNQKCVETFGSPQWTKPENIVTSGAYDIQFRRIRDRIRLVKSDTYWNRDQVRLGIVDALAVDSYTTALNLFIAGGVDWIITPPPAAMRIMLQEDPPRNDLNPAPFLGVYYYMLNTKRKPLNDFRVRKALSLAMNREEITSKLMAAGEIPCLSLVPPGIEGYEAQETFAENVKEAQRLMAEAGFPEGKGFPRLDILYNTSETHQAIAELIRKQWQQVLGIAIKTRNEEWASCLSSQRNMQYNISRRAWIGDYTDPNTFLDMFVSGGEQNNTGFSSADYDRLIVEAGREADPAKRFQLLQQAERILMDELPILPIYFYVSKNMVKPHVRGFYNNIQDVHPLWAMSIDLENEGPNEFMQAELTKAEGQP